MPKLTFFNLPDDKKQTLLAEAKKEFSRVPLFEASIANIIKAAGIPRGSFYQYFEDKEDLYFYLLGEFIKEKRNSFILFLEKNNGDLFESFTQLFKLFLQENEEYHFLRNALLNMTFKIEKTFEEIVNHEELHEDWSFFISKVDKSKLNINNDNEIVNVLQILTTITLRNVIQAFSHETPITDVLQNFALEMNLLKNGLSKKSSL